MRLPRLRRALAAATATALLAGCGTSAGNDITTSASAGATTVSTVAEALAEDIEVETGEVSYDEGDLVDIRLAGSAATSDSDAVSTQDGTVTISAAGTYRLQGELTGQVVVDSSTDGVVRLVLDGATITSGTTSAINVADAGSVVVVLADGSDNTLSDATTYEDDSEDAPTGALYSSADLTIGGSGALTVDGNANNGIVGKDGLVLTGGSITVTSVDDGIIGKDYLVVADGTVLVDAVDDGLKSDNTTDPGTGFVLLEGGTVQVASQDDGIKGVQVLVAGGTVDVTGSTEALEGSLVIIDGGDLELHSADDGINVASSDDSAATDGRAGGGMEADSSLHLHVNGGTVEVWSSGDGLDSNGDATITGGDITVYGPTSEGNGALDVNGTLDVTGGTLLATGSAGMMVAPGTDSPQGWIATALTAAGAAGSALTITDTDGDEVAAYTVEKDYASVVYSSAGIEPGATYTLTVDGTAVDVVAGEAPAGGRGPLGR